MKHLKFLMVAFTFLMGISLTSCMGESDPTVTQATFGKIVGSFPAAIETPLGIKFTATNDLSGQTLYPGDYVYFQYSYNSDLQKVDQNTKNIDATITIVAKITNKSAIPADDKGESYENVTILQIGDGPNADPYYGLQPFYYDKSKLILPVLFLSKGEVTGHDFNLVYSQGAIEADDTEIVFYLRHRSSDTKPDKNAGLYLLYDLYGALEEFKVTTGNKPVNIVIYANETKDKTSDALDKKKDELTKYTLKYSEYFKD